MTREQAKELLPILQAWAEGKEVELKTKEGSEWSILKEDDMQYIDIKKCDLRIKPKYRPFKSQEECWNEMLKHQPFGWIRSTICDNLYIIESISNEINYNRTFTTYNEAFEWVKFADGTPFGIIEN